MFKRFFYFATLLVFLIPQALYGKETLKVGVGNFPPFFIKSTESGLFIEVTRAIFQNLPEYQLEFVFMSNKRLLHEIEHSNRIDVACNIFKNSAKNSHLSDPLFRYTDVAVTKKSNNYQIETVADLANFSIAAYQGATDLLGEDFKKMAAENDQYSEHPHPKDTTYLTVIGAKDVRVGDIHIFYYDLDNKLYRAMTDSSKADFNIHYLWPDVYSHMAFRDEKLKDKVNREIRVLMADGTLDEIYQKYRL